MLDSLDLRNPDFYDVLKKHYAHLVPEFPHAALEKTELEKVPLATTILAIRYAEGVAIAGDRQATDYNLQVGERRIQKIFSTDEYSAVGIAGAAGPCIETAKILQVQLDYYEKLEGVSLSLEGKANMLANMVRANLPAAMQGLIVIPIFAGYDLKRQEGRIFKYDITGGRYEEIEYYATGSGGKDARGTLKKLYRRDADRASALRAVLEALWDAADEDLGTGGPDFLRGIFPNVKLITRDGTENVPDAEVEEVCQTLANELRERERPTGRS